MALTVAQLVARVTADTSGFYRGMAVANSSMIRSGAIISRVAAGAGLATLGMGIMSLRAAGNFEQSMNILQAVAEPTKEQFEDLRDEAIALGADLKLPNVSAKDAADAMQELAKGGLDVNQILGATRGTLQLGLAANIGYADSAVIVARALKAFSLEGEDATKVADLFAAAANKSTAEMTDIALGFQMASAQFAAGDQTIQDLTTSLTLMANAGIIGSDAGTSLKTMMNRLMAPTKKAKDLMTDLGFSVYDSSGNMKAMPDLIGDLTSSLSGMSKEQRNATLYTIFGSDAIRAARVLLREGEKGYRDMTKEITKGGEAAKISEARTKGFNGAMQAFGSAVETLAIILGTALLPAATAAVKGMTRFVMAIDPDKIIGFFSAIKDGIVFFADFVKQSDVAQYTLAALAGAFVGLLVAQQLIGMFRAIQVAWALLNASFVASPIGLVVVAIAALVGALVLAYMKVEWFREAVNGAFSWMRDRIMPIMQDVVNFIRKNWDDIKAAFTTALNVIRTWWELTWGRVLNFIRDNWSTISSVIRAALSIIETYIRGALKTIEGVINLVMGIIKGDWGRAWEGIKQIVSGTLGTMVRVITITMTRLVPALLSLALAAGKAIVTGIINGIAALASRAWGAIRAGVSDAISSTIGWVPAAAAAIGRAIVDGIVSGVTGLPGALGGKLKSGIGSAFSAAKGMLGIGSPSRLAADEIGRPIAEGVIMGWLNGSSELPAKMQESLKIAMEAAKRVIEGYKSDFSEAFGDLVSEVLAAFDEITRAHKTAAEKALEAWDFKQMVEENKARLRELREALKEEQDKLAQMKPPTLVQQEGESAEEFRQRAEREMAEYSAALTAQGERVKEAEKTLDEERERQREARQRARLQKEAEASRVAYEKKRALEKKRLQQELEDLEEALIKHPKKHKEYQDKIMVLLRNYGVSYRQTGLSLGKWFAQGIEDAYNDVVRAANKLAAAVAAILRLRSPAKEGPLSDLDKWWTPFAPTLLSGLNTNTVSDAVARMVAPPGYSGTPGAITGALSSSTAGRAGGATYVNIYHIEGSLIREQDLDDRILMAQRRNRHIGKTP